MRNEKAVRLELAAACRRLDECRFNPGTSGNVSARVDGRTILISPTGSVLGKLTPRQFVRVALDDRFRPKGKPSIELAVHAMFYRVRADVEAVVHAHPPACVGVALARADVGRPTHLEICLTMGIPQMIPFGAPGAVSRAFERAARIGDCFILCGHGVMTIGPTIGKALHRMEQMENFAQATIAARMLGGAKALSRAEMGMIRRFVGEAGIELPKSLSLSGKRSRRR